MIGTSKHILFWMIAQSFLFQYKVGRDKVFGLNYSVIFSFPRDARDSFAQILTYVLILIVVQNC